MQKTILLSIAILILGSYFLYNHQNEHQDLFSNYKLEYQKTYSFHEEAYRKIIFIKNIQAIQLHNSNPHKSYTQGINQFTDLTPTQFLNLYLSPYPLSNNNHQHSLIKQENSNPKVSIDWVAAGKVNPIQDQGQCGASWAFSAVAAIESAYLINGTSQIKLSEQQMLDCTQSQGNYGCNGGYMSSTFKYVKEKGIYPTSAYPYVGKDMTCQKPTATKWKISSYGGDSKGCNFLLNALTKGPVSVAVDATNFYSYKSGVLNKCGNSPNSGSVVVGVTDTFWLLKESFGKNFGENGYVRIAPGNSCAVCQMVSYPIL